MTGGPTDFLSLAEDSSLDEAFSFTISVILIYFLPSLIP